MFWQLVKHPFGRLHDAVHLRHRLVDYTGQIQHHVFLPFVGDFVLNQPAQHLRCQKRVYGHKKALYVDFCQPHVLGVAVRRLEDVVLQVQHGTKPALAFSAGVAVVVQDLRFKNLRNDVGVVRLHKAVAEIGCDDLTQPRLLYHEARRHPRDVLERVHVTADGGQRPCEVVQEDEVRRFASFATPTAAINIVPVLQRYDALGHARCIF